jgi:hypothetical protein
MCCAFMLVINVANSAAPAYLRRVSCRQVALPLLQGYQLAPSHGRRAGPRGSLLLVLAV